MTSRTREAPVRPLLDRMGTMLIKSMGSTKLIKSRGSTKLINVIHVTLLAYVPPDNGCWSTISSKTRWSPASGARAACPPPARSASRATL